MYECRKFLWFGASKIIMTRTFHRKRVVTQKLVLVMPMNMFDHSLTAQFTN